MAHRFVFVHDRRDWLLAAILITLGKRGHRCTVIGCKEYEGVGGCDCSLSLDDLRPALSDCNPFEIFSKFFHTPTVNDRAYERFCFERWFYLYAYAKKCADTLVYLDSDYLISADFSPSLLPYGFSTFYDTPFINAICGTTQLELFLNYLARIQFDSELARQLAEKYAVSGKPHLSDMHCLIEYSRDNPESCVQLTSKLLSLGLCPNISNGGPFKMVGPVRCVSVDASRSRYFCIDKNNDKIIPFYSLHFQGLFKALAPSFMQPLIMASCPWDDHSILDLYMHYLATRKGYWITKEGREILTILQILPDAEPISCEREQLIIGDLLYRKGR